MNVYSVDMRLAATIYVKAESEKEARDKALTFAAESFEFLPDAVTVSDAAMDDPNFPEISLSPVMTGWGLYGGKRAKMNVLAEDAPPIAVKTELP